MNIKYTAIGMIVSALAAASAGIPALAGESDAFCKSLNSAVSEMSNDFEDIKGYDVVQEPILIGWLSKIHIPGFTSCIIEADDGGLECEILSLPNEAQELHASFEKEVDRCFPNIVKDKSDGDVSYRVPDTRSGFISISIINTIREEHTVLLSVYNLF